MWDTLECGTWGSMNRFGMYCDEYIDVPQCDFSCMISREMFDEFQLPVLTEEINALKGNIYHFDGPDALQHTESLCSIDNLHMIQWQPGVGHYDTDWTWLYEKIDSLGTGLVFQGFSGLDRNGKIDIWRNFDSKKILFQTWGDDAEHIDEFLEKLEEVGK